MALALIFRGDRNCPADLACFVRRLRRGRIPSFGVRSTAWEHSRWITALERVCPELAKVVPDISLFDQRSSFSLKSSLSSTLEQNQQMTNAERGEIPCIFPCLRETPRGLPRKAKLESARFPDLRNEANKA